MARALTEQVSPWIQTQVRSDVLQFNVGQPGPELLASAFDMIAEATEATLRNRELNPWLMQYADERGSEKFRNSVASFYSRQTGSATPSDEIIQSTGISGGLQLLGSTLAEAGDFVVVEQPTYFLARDVFESVGLKVLPAPMDDLGGGIDFPALTKEIASLEAQGHRVKLLYIVPIHSNPTARCKTREEKKRIVDYCRDKDIYILADEVYELLNFETPRGVDSPPFREICRENHVVSLGSFSKICGPGLRLGWIMAGEGVVRRVRAHGVLSSGGGMNPLVGAIMAHALDQHLMDRLLSKSVNPILADKSRALCTAINKVFGAEVTYDKPRGGYFVLITFANEEVSTTELLEVARSEFSVSFTPGERCLGPANTARLSFAFYKSEEMEEGVLRLKRAVDHYLAQK